MKNSKKRHLVKTFTWRFTATLTTIILTWLITGDYRFGLEVGFWEFSIKMVLYYFHERVWYRIIKKSE